MISKADTIIEPAHPEKASVFLSPHRGLIVHLLAIIIAQTKIKDALGSQFFQSFVNIFSHCIVVFVCLVAQSKYLKTEQSTTHIRHNTFSSAADKTITTVASIKPTWT